MKWTYEGKECEGYICDIDPTWEEELEEVFDTYYKMFSNLFADSEVVLADVKEELIPLMVVVSQIASSNYSLENEDTDTSSFLDVLFAWMNQLELETDILKLVDDRLHLYNDIIFNGKKPRYEWLMFNAPEGTPDIVSRCHAVFGDILINPSCADNYEKAPAVLHSVFKVREFSIKMAKFYYLVIEFYNKVYDLFSQRYPQQPQKKKQEAKKELGVPPFMVILWIALCALLGFSLLLLALNV